jgi:DNA-binding LacI/PurR family transcriptional regulator/signal transduction histidine kinase
LHEVRTFGVLAPFVGGDYFGAIIAGINHAAAKEGNRIIGFQTLDPGTRSADYAGVPEFRSPLGWRYLDGVIVLPGAVHGSYARAIQLAGKPVVLVAHRLSEIECSVVLADNRVGIRTAVAHLVEHGHERIAFAANLQGFDTRERHKGYREALVEHGIVARPELVFKAPDNHETGGEEVAEALIRADVPVTAIVMGTDRNAIGLIRRLTAAGYELPRDLAIVGFDDITDARYSRPSLSTVRQPPNEIGAKAYELVRDEVAGLPPRRGTHNVATQFVQRESCGCPGRGLQLTEAQMRAQFADNVDLQVTLNTQYELGIELLGSHGSHEGDVRALSWLRRTPALGACLGLWPGAPDQTSAAAETGTLPSAWADSEIQIVGEYHTQGDPPVSVGAVIRVSEFPPRGLFDLADGLVGEAVLVVPVRKASRDWGVLAVVGSIQDRAPPGSEVVNHSGALLVVALERSAMQRSLQEKEEIAIASAHYAGMAEIANDVLHNVGNVLNSVKVSCAALLETFSTSRVGILEQVAGMLEEHSRAGPADLASYLAEDPRGKLLPAYLIQVSRVLQREKQNAVAEVSRVRDQMSIIEQVVAAQQDHSGRRLLTRAAELSRIMDDVLALRADALARKRIAVVKNYRPIAPVHVQRTKLTRVLNHMLQNAEEALLERSDDNRQVTVDIGVNEVGAAYIRIQDNGEGIAAENLTRIFGHGFTTRKQRSGIGLHYCANSMTEMGGRMAVESDGPGRGAAFLLIFGQREQPGQPPGGRID